MQLEILWPNFRDNTFFGTANVYGRRACKYEGGTSVYGRRVYGCDGTRCTDRKDLPLQFISDSGARVFAVTMVLIEKIYHFRVYTTAETIR